jgi:hypothetical protein
MDNPDHISESLETIILGENTVFKFFDADPGSGMEKIWIRDPGWKTSDPGSGINIPDPHHWSGRHQVLRKITWMLLKINCCRGGRVVLST